MSCTDCLELRFTRLSEVQLVLARALISYCCVIIVLIDSARQEFSNGGQFVKFDHSDSNGENLAVAVESDLAELYGK